MNPGNNTWGADGFKHFLLENFCARFFIGLCVNYGSILLITYQTTHRHLLKDLKDARVVIALVLLNSTFFLTTLKPRIKDGVQNKFTRKTLYDPIIKPLAFLAIPIIAAIIVMAINSSDKPLNIASILIAADLFVFLLDILYIPPPFPLNNNENQAPAEGHSAAIFKDFTMYSALMYCLYYAIPCAMTFANKPKDQWTPIVLIGIGVLQLDAVCSIIFLWINTTNLDTILHTIVAQPQNDHASNQTHDPEQYNDLGGQGRLTQGEGTLALTGPTFTVQIANQAPAENLNNQPPANGDENNLETRSQAFYRQLRNWTFLFTGVRVIYTGSVLYCYKKDEIQVMFSNYLIAVCSAQIGSLCIKDQRPFDKLAQKSEAQERIDIVTNFLSFKM